MVVNGWGLFAHPLLLDQFESLIQEVERDREKKPEEYKNGPSAKLLAALCTFIFETVPTDPTRNEYRQGDTLGPENRHWFRVKFGNQRFRLFFRYDSKMKVIIYAWVNDEKSKRTYGSKTDAYAVFKRMLDRGNPPNDWDELLKACRSEPVTARFAAAQLGLKHP